MSTPAVEIKDVTFSYNKNPVLRDVTFSIKEGDFLAFIGPNGSGKTTLLKVILGLLSPDRGSVRIFGKHPREVSDRVGYVPQDVAVNKAFPVTVLDIVLMGRLGHVGRIGHYSQKDKKMALIALEKVGMERFSEEHIVHLSGGQRQRVYIARALVANPDILFMDEPTAGVDTRWQSNLYKLLHDLNKKMTIVVVSHDISVLSSYVKSIACVNVTVHYHDAAEITSGMLEKAYHCPVELIAHGIPHRVLPEHKDTNDA